MSAEIKAELEKIGKSWEASKTVQNELDAKLEKGLGGIAELKAKQDKIDADLDRALKMKETMEQMQAAIARMQSENVSGESKKDNSVYNAAMKKWLKSGLQDNLANVNMSEVERKALQANIDPQGGYTLQPFFGAKETIAFDTSAIRSMASVQSISTTEYIGYHDDEEFGASWVGEINTRAVTTTAELGEFRIPVREMYSRFAISEQLLEDSSFNLESWAQEKVASKFGRVEATAFISGATTRSPQGLITGTVKTSNSDVYTRGQIGTVETAGATAITADELITLGEKLKIEYLANAYYFFNRATRAYVRKLKDGQGNYLWQPSFQMGVADELNGQRVVVFEDMPTIAASAISVGFGDIRRAYRIIDRVGMSVLKDPFTAAVTGQIMFHVRRRVGGGIQNWDAIKYLKQHA